MDLNFCRHFHVARPLRKYIPRNRKKATLVIATLVHCLGLYIKLSNIHTKDRFYEADCVKMTSISLCPGGANLPCTKLNFSASSVWLLEELDFLDLKTKFLSSLLIDISSTLKTIQTK